jgi:hypothetical protein
VVLPGKQILHYEQSEDGVICAGKDTGCVMVDFSSRLDAEAAVQLATMTLERHQLRVVRNFDLRDALHAQDSPCTCPHHGTADCKCNYVVLLVYDRAPTPDRDASPAGRIVVHSHDGSTWFSVPTPAEEPQIRPDPQTDRRLLRALAEVVYEAAL